MRRPAPLLIGVTIAFVLALGAGQFVGTDLFPEVDAGQFSV